MRKKLVTIILVGMAILCMVACSSSEKSANSKKIVKLKDWTNNIENSDSDIYYENSLGGKLTKDEYDRMILIYSRESLKNMDKQTLDLVKDDTLVGSTFDFYSDMHQGDEAIDIEFVDKEFKYSGEENAVDVKFEVADGDFNIEMSGEEAVKRAKDETTLEDYTVVRLSTSINEKIYRVSLAKAEDSREFQRVYIGWDGLTIAVVNVSVNEKWDERKLLFEPVSSYDSVMTFNNFNSLLENEDFCNCTSIDITKEEFENMLIARPEKEIFEMNEKELESIKDNHEIFTETFDYKTDISKDGELVSERVEFDSAWAETVDEVNRDEAIEIAKKQIDTPFYYIKAAVSGDGSVYRISFALEENSKEFKRVYIGKDGRVKDVVNVKYVGEKEDFIVS